MIGNVSLFSSNTRYHNYLLFINKQKKTILLTFLNHQPTLKANKELEYISFLLLQKSWITYHNLWRSLLLFCLNSPALQLLPI